MTYISTQSVGSFSQLISYAWFNLTGNNTPRAYPRGFAIFGLSWGSIPHPPSKQKETIPHPRAADRPHIRFLGTWLFDPYKSKMRRFYNFHERFPKFIERRIMDAIIKLKHEQ